MAGGGSACSLTTVQCGTTMVGELARYDGFDESRADFSRWKGIYETWLRRKQAYTEQIQRDLAETLRVQPAY